MAEAIRGPGMGKRSDTRDVMLLAVELLRRIPRHGKVTATELQQQLAGAGIERSLRTIQRQLEMLTAHFPLERDERSKPYGYRWMPEARPLTIPGLTLQESLLLRLAEEHLRNLLPVRLMQSMEGFFSQARQNLGPSGPDSPERAWPDKVRVVATSQPLLAPQIAKGVFEAACEALYADRWLHIDYRNAAGRKVSAKVMPLGLVQQGPRLYLVSRFEGYDDDRSLALHRILSAKVSTMGFKRPKDFDLKRLDDDGRFGFGEGERVRLSFHITKAEGAHLLETPLARDQQVTELDDGYRINATVVDSAMLEWWLRGFGEAVSQVQRTRLGPQAAN